MAEIREVKTISFVLDNLEFRVLQKVLDNLSQNVAHNQLSITPEEYTIIESIRIFLRELD